MPRSIERSARAAATGHSARLARPFARLAAAAALALAAGTAHSDTVVHRVNCGGPALAALDAGPAWSADVTGAPSAYFANVALAGDFAAGSDEPMVAPHPSVPSYVPLALFDDERWDPGPNPDMLWEFPVANGSYRVNLLVAEGYSGAQSPGARVFDVRCEGATAVANLDLYASYGGYTPGLRSFVVTVADGSLSLEFLHGAADNPSIRGIEIRTYSLSGVLNPSRTSVSFGNAVVGATSPAQQVTLTNAGSPGDPAITLTDVQTSGPFTHTLTLQSLAPGQSRTFNVRFAPVALGAASGSITIAHDGEASPLVIALDGTGVATMPVAFGKSTLQGVSVTNPTTLQIGPDGRLYVGERHGLLHAITLARTGPNQYAALADEVITSVQAIPNHTDDGVPIPFFATRLVTGLLATGTAANPVLYVTSSDPRMNVAEDVGLDTNSGIVSRLTWDGSQWVKLDLVRGLPRCEDDHSTNGLVLDTLTNTLYVAQGANTNMGAPSNNFSFLPEYALSGAILSVDLDAIGETTYDLPTLDDETRPGTVDAGDPFGGNDGRNQAILVPGGPVQVHSPGYRNPYDVVLTSAGRLYSIDNGPNSGWGGPPVGEGPGGACTNGDNDSNSASLEDNLHYIPAAGYYAGHPNPTRASVANTFNTSNPQSPVPFGNPVECDYLLPGPLAGGGDGSLARWGYSTNGLTEYRASNFGGAMTGDLLAASFSNNIERVKLSAAGDSAVLSNTLFSNVGVVPLDVTAQGDDDVFPGTIWVADYVASAIVVYEPADYEGGGGECAGLDSTLYDDDGDGFSNADEIDNGTSPCSAGDVPPDFDGDFLSDRNDPDDDADGLPDLADAFARDATNGATALPVTYTWDGGSPGFGLFGMGFTGLMLDGVTDYLDQYDPLLITAGGAAGKFTVDAVTSGDAFEGLNDQAFAFQFGVATDTTTGAFRVRSRVASPYFNDAPPAGAQSAGIYVGDGGDDDYLKLVVTGDGGAPALAVVHEVAGVATTATYPMPGLFAATGVDVALLVDPLAATVQPLWSTEGGALAPLGSPIALAPGSALSAAVREAAPLAVGVIATSRGATPFTATWDYVQVALAALADAPEPVPVAATRLLPAYPNPVRGAATLRYEIAAPARVRHEVFALSGARVRTLESGHRAAGGHAVHWDARDADGRRVPPGVYYQRLEVDGRTHRQRLIVLK